MYNSNSVEIHINDFIAVRHVQATEKGTNKQKMVNVVVIVTKQKPQSYPQSSKQWGTHC